MKTMKKIMPFFVAFIVVVFVLTIEPVSASQRYVTSWASLQDAITYADENDVIIMENDIKAESRDTTLVVPEGVSATIDLNGHVLDRNILHIKDDGNLFEVKGSLTITDSEPNTSHKDGDDKDLYSYKVGERTVVVTGGVITGGNQDGNGGAIYVDGGKNLTLNGGTIIGNKATAVSGVGGNDTGQGGGVYVGGSGTFEMNNGAVAGNVAFSNENGDDRYRRGDGGGVFMAGSTFNLNGGTVAGNTAEQDMNYPDNCGNAGGVYLSNGTLNMKGGSIKGNKSVRDGGGGIYMTSGSSLNMEGGTIVNNSAINGGGVYAEFNARAFKIKNASIAGNHADADGGGVNMISSKINLEEGGKISDNKAEGKGGGVYFKSSEGFDASVTMNEGSAISGNQAYTGGGVFNDYLETALIMNGGEISDNVASREGGGVRILYGSMSMNGGTVTRNRAATGGGIYSGSYFSIGGKSEIYGNLKGNNPDAGPDNVYLDKYSSARRIEISENLSNKIPIGIWIDSKYLGNEDQRTLTSGYGDNTGAGDPGEHFVSENDGYTVNWNNSGTELLLTKSSEVLDYTMTSYEGFYDGEEHSIAVNVTEPKEGVKIQYRVVGDQDYQDEVPTFINAGEYEVEFLIQADGVEHAVRNKATVKIKPVVIKLPTSKTLTYNGMVQTGVAVGRGYTITGNKATNAGTYTAILKLRDKKNTIWSDGKIADKKVKWIINKANNPINIIGKTVKIKYKKLKKRKKGIAVSKVLNFTNQVSDMKTYKLSSAKKGKKSFKKYFKIYKTTGMVTVKKGLKKGTYKVKVKVMALGNMNYNASAFKLITFKVKVK